MNVPLRDPNEPPPVSPGSQWQTPPTANKPYPRPTGAPQPADPLGGLIPADNPPSLVAYYCGLFSCFPLLGVVLAVIALMQGLKALSRIKENPGIHGKAHAWTGLICAGISLTYHLVFLILMVVAAATSKPST